MLVLLTGASGFLGSHVVDRLRADGHRVRAIVRPTSDVAQLRVPGVELATADLAGGPALEEAARGVDAVIHAAGGGVMRRVEDLYASNRDTTVALLEAVEAGSPGLSRFVLVSSVAALGPSPPGEVRPADAPPAPVSHYGRAKAAAEAATLARADRLPVTVLRPPALYGPRDTRLLGLFRAVARGWLPLLGRGRATSLCFGPDCAAALAALLERPHASGRVYGVDDGAVHGWEAIGEHLAAAVGRRPRRLRLPVALVPPAAAAVEAAARLRGRPVTFGRDKARDLVQARWASDASALRRETGWAPTVDLAEGFRRTAAWYREAGWLP